MTEQMTADLTLKNNEEVRVKVLDPDYKGHGGHRVKLLEDHGNLEKGTVLARVAEKHLRIYEHDLSSKKLLEILDKAEEECEKSRGKVAYNAGVSRAINYVRDQLKIRDQLKKNV